MTKNKKEEKTKKILLTVIISCIITMILIYLYYTYQNIEIYDTNYETQRTISTVNEQTVENAIENSQTVSDILEETTGSVVGISKLKRNNSSPTIIKLQFRNGCMQRYKISGRTIKKISTIIRRIKYRN